MRKVGAELSAVQQARQQDSRRGAILLVAMAILALLAIFAVSFARLVSLEKSASANYIDSVRARMVARGGLERAVAELRRLAEVKPYDDVRPVANDGDPWVYRQRYSNGATLGDGNRGNNALSFVSFSQTADISFPVQHNVFEVKQGPEDAAPIVQFTYSGILGASYANGVDSYRLKVLDCASMIHVNGGDLSALQRMLKNLLRAHDFSNADANAIANRVRDQRPGGGYRTKAEVGLVMRNGAPAVTDDEWRLIRDDITCFAWKDTKVILPPKADPGTGGTTTTTSASNANVTLTERAPVNMNTASKEVLAAVFAEIEGEIFRKSRIYNGSTESFAPSVTTVTIPFTSAVNLAAAVESRRRQTGTGEVDGGPFRSWFEFETWLDTTTIAGLGGNQKDLIKAMVNPNTDIAFHKFGGEGNHIWRWQYQPLSGNRGAFIPTTVPRVVDKTDLTQITTEMCFASMGFFEITSLGQIWESGRINGAKITLQDIRAEQTVQSVIQVYNVMRLTHQQDFERNREHLDPKLYLPFSVGSTGNVQGFNPDLISEAGAWPSTLTQPDYSNRHVLPTGSSSSDFVDGADNLTLHPSYSPATYDGQITLNGLARIVAQNEDFMVGFARGKLDALKGRYYETDKAKFDRELNNTPANNQLITVDPTVQNSQGFRPKTFNDSSVRSMLNEGGPFADLFDGSALCNLGVLLTDDRARYLVYNGDNIELRQGTIHFWIKPVKDLAANDKQVYFSWFGGNDPVSGVRHAGFEIFKERNGSEIALSAKFYGLWGGLNTETLNDVSVPVAQVAGSNVTPMSEWRLGQWNHVQLAFGVDLNATNPRYTAQLIINSQPMAEGQVDISRYSFGGTLGVRHAYATGPSPATSVGQRGNQWRWPYLFYDYYYCDAANRTFSTQTHTEEITRIDASAGGAYLPSPSIPASSVTFPTGAFDKQVLVRYEDSSGNDAGSTSTNPPDTFDPADLALLSSETVPDSGDWGFAPPQEVRDNEHTIVYIKQWKTVTEDSFGSGGHCSDCRNCQDCSTPLGSKLPTSYLNPNNPQGSRCYNRFDINQGELSLTECDDCQGCEACDVDGPVFIGAELYYNPSQAHPLVSSAVPNNTNTSTDNVFHFAQAMIDNIYFLGYRVDESDGGVEGVPSDRFYDSNVARINQSNESGRGHRPGYKRRLVELFGQSFTLGTISWTGYPGYNRSSASAGTLDANTPLPVTITMLRWDYNRDPNVNNPAAWEAIDYTDPPNPDQETAVNTDFQGLAGAGVATFFDGICSSNPTNGVTNVIRDPSVTLGFRDGATASNDLYDILQNPQDPDRGGEGLTPVVVRDGRNIDPRQLLILSVDFAPVAAGSAGLYQTPVLNDVTITYFTTPKVIYTEEGVDE